MYRIFAFNLITTSAFQISMVLIEFRLICMPKMGVVEKHEYFSLCHSEPPLLAVLCSKRTKTCGSNSPGRFALP